MAGPPDALRQRFERLSAAVDGAPSLLLTESERMQALEAVCLRSAALGGSLSGSALSRRLRTSTEAAAALGFLRVLSLTAFGCAFLCLL
jgi:hypothetical protein